MSTTTFFLRNCWMSVSDTEYNNFEWDVNIDGLMENNVKVICKKKKKC